MQIPASSRISRYAAAALLLSAAVACGVGHQAPESSRSKLVVPPSGGAVEVGYLMAPSQRYATVATTSVCADGQGKVTLTSVEAQNAEGRLEVSDFGIRRVRDGESLTVVEPDRLNTIFPAGTTREVQRRCGVHGDVTRLLIEVSRPDARLAGAESFRVHYRSGARTGSKVVDFGVKLCEKDAKDEACG